MSSSYVVLTLDREIPDLPPKCIIVFCGEGTAAKYFENYRRARERSEVAAIAFGPDTEKSSHYKDFIVVWSRDPEHPVGKPIKIDLIFEDYIPGLPEF